MDRPTFRHFNDFPPEEVNFDFHMHTTQTDGKNTAEEMIAAASELGLAAIAFSEHVNRSSSWYPEFVAHVGTLRASAPIRVYIGIEAKPLDFEGTIDASVQILDAAELIVGSVHRFPDGNGGLIPMAQVPSLGADKAIEIELGLALGLIRNPASRMDVLGHPMGISTKNFGGFPERAMRTLMMTCREHGVAFEISTKYCTDLGRLVGLLRETNPLVSVGSDAHEKGDIGRSFAQLKHEMAR
jgi:putative hydrolase